MLGGGQLGLDDLREHFASCLFSRPVGYVVTTSRDRQLAACLIHLLLNGATASSTRPVGPVSSTGCASGWYHRLHTEWGGIAAGLGTTPMVSSAVGFPSSILS